MNTSTSLTIANATGKPGVLLVTLHLPMEDGQQILLSMLQTMGEDSLQRIQARLIRDARKRLDILEGSSTP